LRLSAAFRPLGQPVVRVAIRGHADPALAAKVDAFYWTGLARLGRMIRCFKREGVERLVLAGKSHKVHMHRRWRWLQLWPDWRTLRFWYNRQRATDSEAGKTTIVDEPDVVALAGRHGMTIVALGGPCISLHIRCMTPCNEFMAKLSPSSKSRARVYATPLRRKRIHCIRSTQPRSHP
jgi:DUF1009 family protein